MGVTLGAKVGTAEGKALGAPVSTIMTFAAEVGLWLGASVTPSTGTGVGAGVGALLGGAAGAIEGRTAAIDKKRNDEVRRSCLVAFAIRVLSQILRRTFAVCADGVLERVLG